jgi:DNA polymerase-1
MNQPIQSSSADMTKLAMVRTQRALDPQRARIAITVHDELVIEADLDYAEEAAALTKAAM